MDKKELFLKGLLFFVVLGVSFLAVFLKNYTDIDNTDAKRFKEEYESLNDTVRESDGATYNNVSIPLENPMKYVTALEASEIIKNKTGIIYIGANWCPWCRNAVPIIIEAAKKNEIGQIYYFDASKIRDVKELKNGKVITTKEGTKEYYKLLDKLKDVLDPYEGLKDENIKRLYFPTMVFVMGGKVVATHTGTVESQKDPYKKLTNKEEKELLKIYEEAIEKIYGVCDESC